jgi:uncharacterized protein
LGRALDLRRCRANVVIAADGVSEEKWLGARAPVRHARVIRRAGASITQSSAARVPTIDPDSAARDATILRLLVEDFGNEIGAYGAVEARGTISVGDPVHLAQQCRAGRSPSGN